MAMPSSLCSKHVASAAIRLLGRIEESRQSRDWRMTDTGQNQVDTEPAPVTTPNGGRHYKNGKNQSPVHIQSKSSILLLFDYRTP